ATYTSSGVPERTARARREGLEVREHQGPTRDRQINGHRSIAPSSEERREFRGEGSGIADIRTRRAWRQQSREQRTSSQTHDHGWVTPPSTDLNELKRVGAEADPQSRAMDGKERDHGASSEKGHAVDFLHRRLSGQDLDDAGIAQTRHTGLHGRLTDVRRRFLLQNEILDPVGHRKKLGNRMAPAKAQAMAVHTALFAVEHTIREERRLKSGLLTEVR